MGKIGNVWGYCGQQAPEKPPDFSRPTLVQQAVKYSCYDGEYGEWTKPQKHTRDPEGSPVAGGAVGCPARQCHGHQISRIKSKGKKILPRACWRCFASRSILLRFNRRGIEMRQREAKTRPSAAMAKAAQCWVCHPRCHERVATFQLHSLPSLALVVEIIPPPSARKVAASVDRL